MRKLAPMVLISSIAALVCGTTFATTGATNSTSPDKATGSPSVEANVSNPQGLSYGDKSNTSPGTNARMDDKSAVTAGQMPAARVGSAMDNEDKPMTERMHKHKAKKAKDGDPNTVNSIPIDSSNGAAVNSSTGTSPGR